MKKTILIVDDEQDIIDLLSYNLSKFLKQINLSYLKYVLIAQTYLKLIVP